MARFYKPRKYGRRPSKKTKTVRKAIRSVKKSNFKKSVLSVIKSQAEDKHAYHTNGNASLVMFNSTIDAVSDMVQIIPSISESAFENGRVGERIRVSSFNVRGYLKFNTNVATGDLKNGAVAVRMFLLSMKGKLSKDAVESSANPLQLLLRKGGATAPFSGLISDITSPVNTDVFTVHYDKVMYLNQSSLINFGTPTNTAVASNTANLVRFFNINLKCKNKDLKYDDDINSGLHPTNYYPFLCLGYSYMDGSTADTLTQKLGMEFTSHLSYEDM